jgi:hypothetical protein
VDFTNGSEVSLPLTRIGQYNWTSPVVAPNGNIDTFNVSYRVLGDATVTGAAGGPVAVPNGYVMRFSFNVTAFSPGASVVILNSRGYNGGGR